MLFDDGNVHPREKLWHESICNPANCGLNHSKSTYLAAGGFLENHILKFFFAFYQVFL